MKVSTFTEATASTAGSTEVVTLLSTVLRARLTVKELVVIHADVLLQAFKDADLHVGDTLGSNDSHVVAVHVG